TMDFHSFPTRRSSDLTNPGEYPRYPDGVSDNTHFSQLGAQAIAKIVAEAVEELELTISPYVIDPEFVMPEPEPEAQVFEEDFEPDRKSTRLNSSHVKR